MLAIDPCSVVILNDLSSSDYHYTENHLEIDSSQPSLVDLHQSIDFEGIQWSPAYGFQMQPLITIQKNNSV
jgi:hypothetical protein